MSYQNKVKSDPNDIAQQAIGIKGVNIGVNTNRTYGGSPYTGWYNTFNLPTNVPEKIVMYKANSPAEGTISPGGTWVYNFSLTEIPFSFINQAFTIECWVLFSEGGFSQVDICEIVVGGTPFRFRVNGNGTTSAMFGVTSIVDSSSSMSSNAWNHIAVTRDLNDKINLYINGLNVGNSGFSNNIVPDEGRVDFFKGSEGTGLYFTNLRVVTKTAIYPTESEVGPYPQYPLNRSYDDTVLLVLGKKESNYTKDYSINNVLPETNQPTYNVEVPTPLKKIIDATSVSVSSWDFTSISNGLLELINGHPSRVFQPYFTLVEDAVDWAFNQSTDPLMFSNISYEETDGGVPYFKNCNMFLDSGNISSYPTVNDRHFNLKQYDDFGVIGPKSVTYSEQYGGRLWSSKAGNDPYALAYNGVGNLNAASFVYYGVLGFAQTFIAPHDIVGFYDGDNDWRVERITAIKARLYITDGSGNETLITNFDIIDTEFPTPYFGLLVSYDDSTGDFVVYVNGQQVANGNNSLGRETGNPGGSVFMWGKSTDVRMYHYTSAVWAKGSDYVNIALPMGNALSTRYPGIV